MTKLLCAALALTLAAPVLATPQQERMKTCNAQTKGKTGDERKTFMSACLKGDAQTSLTPQQQKMKGCNAQAAGKKGDERKAFMSACLKG